MQAPPGCDDGELGVVHVRTADDVAELPRVQRVAELHVVGSELEDLTGFECLTTAEKIFIEDNADLRSLEGLGALTTVVKLPELDWFGAAELIIRNNPELTSLTGLDALEFVDGKFVIQGNPSLANLRGLEILQRTTYALHLADNPELETVTELESFLGGEVKGDFGGGGLKIQNNSKLTEVTLHNPLTSALFSIGDNPALTTLNLELAVQPWEYIVRNNPLLTHLPKTGGRGHGYVRYQRNFFIVNNDMLVSLEHFPALVEPDTVEIRENERLVDLRGLENLESTANLRIQNNASLRSAAAIDFNADGALTTVFGELFITGNLHLSMCEAEGIARTIEAHERHPTLSAIDVSRNAPGGICPR